MYAKYHYFLNGENCRPIASTGYTDSTRFACASIPQPPLISPKEEPQCKVDCKIPDPICTYSCETKSLDSSPMGLTKPLKISPVIENFTSKINPSKSNIKIVDKTPISRLLPVMNPEFNLREICKQIILLEDHLSHSEKRCTDCCIKHFLTIEALAEEAITLDKRNEYGYLNPLPNRVRQLQKKWHENPDQNALLVSQQLREIRKEYMISSFGIIFSKESSCNDCTSGVCKLNKK